MADGCELTARDDDDDNVIEITANRLSISKAFDRVSSPGCGATSLFVGTTRNVHGGRPVVRLEYEAYTPMAKQQLLSLCTEARTEWPSLAKISIAHRLGLVPVTEASVIIAVSSPHRGDSLAAVAFVIDRIKASVAIWKKEVYDDGQAVWKENSECKWKVKAAAHHN